MHRKPSKTQKAALILVAAISSTALAASVVYACQMEILDKLYFEEHSTKVKPVSMPVLKAIAALLKGNPQIELTEVQGHADDAGSNRYNSDLAHRRAIAVCVYLVENGVEAKRLICRGYGKTQPQTSGNAQPAHAENRRAEFIILKRSKPKS